MQGPTKAIVRFSKVILDHFVLVRTCKESLVQGILTLQMGRAQLHSNGILSNGTGHGGIKLYTENIVGIK